MEDLVFKAIEQVQPKEFEDPGTEGYESIFDRRLTDH